MSMLERFRLAYRLDFHDGTVTTGHGRAPQRFIVAVRDIARLHDIRHGHVECKGTGRHARLRFSRDFPQKGRQAIRNAWTPPTTPGPGRDPRASG